MQPFDLKLFGYLDFRAFLHDYYKARSRFDRKFSHRFLCERLEEKSPSFFLKVVRGERRLSEPQRKTLSDLMSLDPDEYRYFQALYGYSYARNAAEREYYLGLLAAISAPKQAHEDNNITTFYSQWENGVVLLTLGLSASGNDPTSIWRRLTPLLSLAQTRKSLQIGIELGWIKQDPHTGLFSGDICRLQPESHLDHAALKAWWMRCNELVKIAANLPQRQPQPNMFQEMVTVSSQTFADMLDAQADFVSKLNNLIEADQNLKQHLIQVQGALLELGKSAI